MEYRIYSYKSGMMFSKEKSLKTSEDTKQWFFKWVERRKKTIRTNTKFQFIVIKHYESFNSELLTIIDINFWVVNKDILYDINGLVDIV